VKVTVLNKKTLTIIGLVAMLVVAAIINISVRNASQTTDNDSEQNIENQEEVETVAMTAAQILSSYETERRTTRLKELEYLDEILADETVDEETRNLASQQRMQVMENIQQEQVISEVLIGKGFDRVTVVCGADSVNILVDSASLDDSKVAQILDVVLTETDATAENVKIIPLD